MNANGVVGTASVVTPVLNGAIACPAGATTTIANGGILNGTNTVATSCPANTIGYSAGVITPPTTTTAAFFTPHPNAQYVEGGPGTLPNASRNTFPTSRIDNLDLTALKRFSFRERYRLEFQVQAFNVLNHSQYLPGTLNTVNSTGSTGSGPSNFVTVTAAGTFGNRNVAFSNNARTMQLAGKFYF